MPAEPVKRANHPKTLDARHAAAIAIAGLAVTVATLTTGQWLVSALLFAAALPLEALLWWPSWSHYKYVFAPALSIVLVASAVEVRWYQEHRTTVPPTVTVTKFRDPPSLADQAKNLKFLPVAEPIPHCVTFSGTGTIPAGDALVLLDRPTDPAGYYTTDSTFSYDGPVAASQLQHGWTAPAINIGSGDASDNGAHIAIIALLVPQSVADFLDATTSDSDSGAVPANALALGAQADRLVTIRNTQNAHCP